MKFTKNTCYYIDVKKLNLVQKLKILVKIQKLFKDKVKWGGNSDYNLLEYSTFKNGHLDILFVIYYYCDGYADDETLLMRPNELPKEYVCEKLKLLEIQSKLK